MKALENILIPWYSTENLAEYLIAKILYIRHVVKARMLTIWQFYSIFIYPYIEYSYVKGPFISLIEGEKKNLRKS